MTNRKLLRLLTLVLAALMTVGVAAAPAAIADTPTSEQKAHAPNGPPDDPDKEWLKQWNDRGPENIGVDTSNHWCMMPEANNCSFYKKPDTYDSCEEHNVGCDDPAITEARKQRELAKLKDWEATTDHGAEGYQKMDDAIRKCIEGGMNFHDCQQKNAGLMIPSGGIGDWIAGKISKLASDALKEAAGQIGQSVVWLLKQFAEAFNSVSTINLAQTGIGQVVGMMTVVSVLLAAFLMLIQFGKLAVSQSGAPAATVITGLVKWAFILGCYAFATQVALNWSDALSTWIINTSFEGGGSGSDDATKAMQQQLGGMFAGLVAGGGGASGGAALVTGGGVLSQAVGVVIVLGILCILAIGALWVEMLVRQAGIMILVSTMPVVLAGQLSDGTKEWWPKARNALITLVVMKPVIVTCFAIGFSAMARADGIRNVIVGLIIFLVSAFAWPVVGRFFVFSGSNGNGVGSALLSSVGSGLGAMFGGAAGAAAGAGAVGGGSGYTRALESENEGAADSGGGRGFWSKTLKGSGSFGGGVAAGVGLGLQAAAAGAGMVEGAMGNAAAHAGLGAPAHGGGTVVPPRRARDSASGSGPASTGSGQDSGTGPNSGPAAGGTAEASTPPAPPAASPAATVEQPPPAAAAPPPPAAPVAPTQNGPITLGPVKPRKGEGDK
ncbi:hypothetical protein ACFV1W_30265 [Kitasatospora sp. NPDC059648]|uniref:hypothetical protein n=1 Tax=Kitasatospora sp. NPDC059648 TaxID=3346894 RepID=UPI00367BA003